MLPGDRYRKGPSRFLQALELRNRVEAETGAALAVVELLRGISLARLVELVDEQLGDEGLALARELSDARTLAWALHERGQSALARGNRTHAARLFAEGLTVFGDRVYQLTWRARMALVYSREELEGLEWFPLAGEGWGLTNNGDELIYSDGSHRLHFLSPVTRRSAPAPASACPWTSRPSGLRPWSRCWTASRG